MGTAAAMQALKKFTQSDNNAKSGTGQAAFLGMAMSEASKVRRCIRKAAPNRDKMWCLIGANVACLLAV